MKPINDQQRQSNRVPRRNWKDENEGDEQAVSGGMKKVARSASALVNAEQSGKYSLLLLLRDREIEI